MSASVATEAAQTVGDSARRWGVIAIELASISAGMRDSWSGLAALATFARLDELARRIERAIGEHAYLAEVLAAEGARLEGAIARSDREAAADADAALVALLGTDWEADRVRSLLQGPVAVDESTAPAGLRGHGPLRPPPSYLGVDPAVRAAAWHGLSPFERAAWAERHPGLSDGAGLPATSRDALNRVELARALGGGPAGADNRTHRRMTAAARHLVAQPDARLLGLRPDGRGVLASGDPGDADEVVTLVPGTGASMETIDRSVERADAVCEELGGRGSGGDDGGDIGGERCVSIAWMDYEAPETIPAAALDRGRADDAAPRLREFQEGLREMTDGRLGAIGYSYGGVALGLAAGGSGVSADELAFVAAPGVGAEHASELTLRDGEGTRRAGGPESVSAVASRWDPIPWWALTKTFGPDPSGADFGADSRRLDGFVGHSDYFDRRSVPLAEIGEALGE